MFRAAPTDWLASLRNGLAHGVLLQESDSFHQLARGFVGCNLVIDLVELVRAVVKAEEVALVGAVTARHLHHWLSDEPIDDIPPTALADAESAAAFNEGPGNPWQRLNAWLGFEALLRRTNATVSVYDHARALFETTLAEGLYRRQPQCSQRAPQVVDSFRQWWHAFLPPVTEWLAPARWEEMVGRAWVEEDELRLYLGEELLEQFGTEHVLALGDLLRWKQWQLERCIQQLNAPLPSLVVDWDEVEDLLAGLTAARRAGRAFRYGRAQRRTLRGLLQWAEKAGVGAAHGVRPERFAALQEGGATVEAVAVTDHLADWGPLLRAARMRRLPKDWADHRPVEDLLAYPLPGDFRFAPWRADARRYGLVPGA